jgi:hypothetical protein
MIDLDALVIGPTIATFGQPVTYTPMTPQTDPNGRVMYNPNGDELLTAGTPYAAVGVFDQEYMEITPLGRGPFTSTEAMDFGATGGITEARPVLGIQLSAMLSTPTQGDTVLIGTALYVVKEVQPDGHGHAKLLLNLAPS